MLGLALVLKSTVLLAVAYVVVCALRKKSAALRHLVWSEAFAGLLLLLLLSGPFVSARLPAWRMGRLSGLSEFVFRIDAVGGTLAGGSVHQQHAGLMPLASVNWPLVLVVIWVAGMAVGVGQMLMGWWKLERLRRKSKIFGARQDGVELLEGDAGSIPMTYGLLHPVIFLPADAREWSAERLQIVLRHEMAHVKRGDVATHVLARFVLSVYWWNPLVWLAWREFLKEQERATDDLVLSAGECGSNYAEHLLEIARLMQTPTTSTGGMVMAMANRSQLEGRLEAILDGRRDRSVPRRGLVLAVVMATIALVLPLAAMQTGQAEGGAGKTQATGLLADGDAARDKGKNEEAIAAYTKYLTGKSSGPDVAAAYIHRGSVELVMKDYKTALGDFAMGQAADIGSVSEALMWQGIAEERMKNPDEAARLYRQAIAAGDPHSIQTALVMELHSRILESQGQKDDAVLEKKKALDIRQSQRAMGAKSEITAFRAGGDVVAPKLLSKVEPEYSMEARAALYSGVARLSVVIGADGKAQDVQVVQSLGLGLDQKAIDAVKQWRFQPGMKDGQPVPVRATIEVNFKLL